MMGVIFRGNAPSFLRADEPAVHHAACEPGAAGLHPADCPGEGVLSQRNAEIRNNLCWRIEVIEEPHHTRTEHVTAASARRGLVSGKPEEVIALVMREAQRQRDRVDRLLGRAGAAALLESRVEVGGDVREGGDLLPPQTGGPSTASQRESDVARLERMAGAALDAVHHPDMIAHVPGNAQPIYGRAAHAVAMRQLVQIFPDIHVHTPYPTQFGSGDWITVVTRATGTFTGEMILPNGTRIPPTGKTFDVEFGQTSKWDGDELIVIAAFWDSALLSQQIGMR